jgi:hypothetical protein
MEVRCGFRIKSGKQRLEVGLMKFLRPQLGLKKWITKGSQVPKTFVIIKGKSIRNAEKLMMKLALYCKSIKSKSCPATRHEGAWGGEVV